MAEREGFSVTLIIYIKMYLRVGKDKNMSIISFEKYFHFSSKLKFFLSKIPSMRIIFRQKDYEFQF